MIKIQKLPKGEKIVSTQTYGICDKCSRTHLIIFCETVIYCACCDNCSIGKSSEAGRAEEK